MKSIVRLVFLFSGLITLSQLEHPKASPTATVTQTVGFTTITVDYSRPATKGRKIFGDLPNGQAGLVPYGRIWRVGANKSTKLSFDADVSVEGNSLEKGTYALYAFPEEQEWEIVFHTNTSHWGDGRKKYNPEEDAFRIKVKPRHEERFQESFLIYFDNISHNEATMILHWANTSVSIPIFVDTHSAMEAQITEKLARDPSAQTYYEVARYYVEQNLKYETALSYLNKALELGGDTYYFHRVKSLAEAALGDYKAAIISAEKSLELAQVQDKDEFVRMNQKSIDTWKPLLERKN